MSSTLDNKLVQRQTQAGHLTKFVKMFHCSDLVFETLVKSGQHCNIPKHRTPSYSQFLFLFFFLLQVSLHAFPGQLLLSLVSFRVAPKPLPVSPAFLPALVLLHPPATAVGDGGTRRFAALALHPSVPHSQSFYMALMPLQASTDCGPFQRVFTFTVVWMDLV